MRQSLREYGMAEAERQFGLWLSSEDVGLTGKIDLLLKGAEESVAVDFKLTSGAVRENHRFAAVSWPLPLPVTK